MHVKVLVTPQPPTENHTWLGRCGFPIPLEHRSIAIRVHGVVRLIEVTGEAAELAHNDRPARRVRPFRVQVLKLVNAREGDFLIGIIHDRGTLEVIDI